MITSRSIISRFRNVSGTICRENHHTHTHTHTYFTFSVFFSDNRIVRPIMWKNIVEPNRPQMTIWRMSTALWIPKATNTHSEYVTLIGLLRLQWFRESASVSGCTYIACLVVRTSPVLLYVHRLSCCTYIACLVVRTSPVLLYVHCLSCT